MKITNAGTNAMYFTEEEAREALLACGFDESSLEDAEILASYDPRSGVTEVIIFADVGTWAGNDVDGWNKVNSLQEIGDLDADEINTTFGDGAADLPIWASYLARGAQ